MDATPPGKTSGVTSKGKLTAALQITGPSARLHLKTGVVCWALPTRLQGHPNSLVTIPVYRRGIPLEKTKMCLRPPGYKGTTGIQTQVWRYQSLPPPGTCLPCGLQEEDTGAPGEQRVPRGLSVRSGRTPERPRLQSACVPVLSPLLEAGENGFKRIITLPCSSC